MDNEKKKNSSTIRIFEFRIRTSIPMHNKNANMINSVVDNGGAGQQAATKKNNDYVTATKSWQIYEHKNQREGTKTCAMCALLKAGRRY